MRIESVGLSPERISVRDSVRLVDVSSCIVVWLLRAKALVGCGGQKAKACCCLHMNAGMLTVHTAVCKAKGRRETLAPYAAGRL